MPRIALIQNGSEMRHNVYADVREPLDALGYECELFTAETAASLDPALSSGRFDALLVGSNALNDAVIRHTLRSDAIRSALAGFLDSGRGIVCFHQMALANERSELGFLPEPWSAVGLSTGPDDESADVLVVAPGAEDHPLMHFPERVEPARIEAHARDSTSLSRLWFHLWTGVREDAFTTLLVPRTHDETTMHALLAVSRDARGDRRIVLCALPADWQRAPGLLANVVHYACQGAHPAAVVVPGDGDRAMDVVECWLRSERIPFTRYDERADGLADAIRAGVHETVLLGPEIRVDDLDPVLRGLAHDGVGSGRLRLLEFGERVAGRRTLAIASARLSLADVQRPLEAQALAQLDRGYVDGSFWRTVESIDVLTELAGTAVTIDDRVAARAVARALTHQDEHGAYDGTAAATCGLLRLLDRFGRPEAARAEEWLRRHAARDAAAGEFPAEQFAALVALHETRRQRPAEVERLRALVAGLGDLAQLRELDLLTVVHAAQVAGDAATELDAAGILVGRQGANGQWVDLETTAEAVVRLLALRQRLATAHRGIDRALARATVAIRDAAQRDEAAPWAERVGTSLMCLRALRRVNDTLDIPVNETLDVLRGWTVTAELRAAGDSAARAAEALRRTNQALDETGETLQRRLDEQADALTAALRQADQRSGELDALKHSHRAEVERLEGLRKRWRDTTVPLILGLIGYCVVLLFSATGGAGRLLSASSSHWEGLLAIAAVILAGVTFYLRS